MKLTEYLNGMREASTADELEAAIQAPFVHPFAGKIWSRICNVRIEAGERICATHPNGQFVPQLGVRRWLTVCGEAYRIGNGQNSTGVRYCWLAAKEWALGILAKHGFGKRASSAIWDSALNYPHRSLKVVADALAGKLPDPRFNRLIPHSRYATGNPLKVNRKTESKTRAHRPCKCGGWLWDWGGGCTGYANFLTWCCDRCPRVYTEYVSRDRLTEIRQSPKITSAFCERSCSV